MLRTKFRGNRPTGSGEEDYFGGFYHIWTWRPSWSCDREQKLNAITQGGFNLIGQIASGKKIFEIVDDGRTDDERTDHGRTPDHSHPIRAPCKPSSQVS